MTEQPEHTGERRTLDDTIEREYWINPDLAPTVNDYNLKPQGFQTKFFVNYGDFKFDFSKGIKEMSREQLTVLCQRISEDILTARDRKHDNT